MIASIRQDKVICFNYRHLSDSSRVHQDRGRSANCSSSSSSSTVAARQRRRLAGTVMMRGLLPEAVKRDLFTESGPCKWTN